MDADDELQKLRMEARVREYASLHTRKVIFESIAATHPNIPALIQALKRAAGTINVESEIVPVVAPKYGDKFAGTYASTIQQKIDSELVSFIRMIEEFSKKREPPPAAAE